MNFQPPEEDDPRDEDQLMQSALSQPAPQGVAELMELERDAANKK